MNDVGRHDGAAHVPFWHTCTPGHWTELVHAMGETGGVTGPAGRFPLTSSSFPRPRNNTISSCTKIWLI